MKTKICPMTTNLLFQWKPSKILDISEWRESLYNQQSTNNHKQQVFALEKVPCQKRKNPEPINILSGTEKCYFNIRANERI